MNKGTKRLWRLKLKFYNYKMCTQIKNLDYYNDEKLEMITLA